MKNHASLHYSKIIFFAKGRLEKIPVSKGEGIIHRKHFTDKERGGGGGV